MISDMNGELLAHGLECCLELEACLGSLRLRHFAEGPLGFECLLYCFVAYIRSCVTQISSQPPSLLPYHADFTLYSTFLKQR